MKEPDAQCVHNARKTAIIYKHLKSRGVKQTNNSKSHKICKQSQIVKFRYLNNRVVRVMHLSGN